MIKDTTEDINVSVWFLINLNEVVHISYIQVNLGDTQATYAVDWTTNMWVF